MGSHIYFIIFRLFYVLLMKLNSFDEVVLSHLMRRNCRVCALVRSMRPTSSQLMRLNCRVCALVHSMRPTSSHLMRRNCRVCALLRSMRPTSLMNSSKDSAHTLAPVTSTRTWQQSNHFTFTRPYKVLKMQQFTVCIVYTEEIKNITLKKKWH